MIDEKLFDWLRWASRLPNGVTIQHQAWNEHAREWQDSCYVKHGTQTRYLVTWGAKLGQFMTDDTLTGALTNAMKRRR